MQVFLPIKDKIINTDWFSNVSLCLYTSYGKLFFLNYFINAKNVYFVVIKRKEHTEHSYLKLT